MKCVSALSILIHELFVPNAIAATRCLRSKLTTHYLTEKKWR